MEHYLLECNKYKDQRKQMRLELRKGRMTVGGLLGDPQAIKHTMKYIRRQQGWNNDAQPQVDRTRDTSQEAEEEEKIRLAKHVVPRP